MLRQGEGTRPGGEWGDWLPPAEAWSRVLQAWQPVAGPTEDVPLAELGGRVLAADLIAPFDSPGFDRSAMDGYALRAADSGAGARLQIVGEVAMGADSTVVIGPGQAAWVATGAMIPQGADSVIMVERTTREGDYVTIEQAVSAGDSVVRRGDDLRAGDLVLQAGRRIRPQDVAAIASLGYSHVAVRRKPRVAIVAGGDELVTPGTPLGPGQIYDANSFALAAQVAQWDGQPAILPRVRDVAADVAAALSRALASADIVLLSGGSSVGLKDLTAEAINSAGRPGVIVHGVAMRPGRPTVIGGVDGVLVVGIPGNPVSAMVTCEVFVRPAVETLLGVQPVRTAGTIGDFTTQGRLAGAVQSLAGRQDYVRVRLERSGDEVTVHPVSGGSNAIRSMVAANGLLVVPPELARIESGEIVTVSLF